jgi:hypothetical protein
VLAGNLQTNFNKLDVFVDARAGAGQNSLRSDNPQISFNQLNTSLGASADGSVPGLTFDAGFDADAVFFFTVGGGAPNTMYVDYARSPPPAAARARISARGTTTTSWPRT